MQVQSSSPVTMQFQSSNVGAKANANHTSKEQAQELQLRMLEQLKLKQTEMLERLAEQQHRNDSSINGQLMPIQSHTKPSIEPTLDASVEETWNKHAESIHSSYQTAWQLDLAKLHYQQQKDLFDIYMQSSGVESSNSQHTTNNTVTGSLTEMYSSLYQLHEKIKELEEAASKTPSILPINVAATSAANAAEQRNIRSQQLNAYADVSSTEKTSFLRISA